MRLFDAAEGKHRNCLCQKWFYRLIKLYLFLQRRRRCPQFKTAFHRALDRVELTEFQMSKI